MEKIPAVSRDGSLPRALGLTVHLRAEERAEIPPFIGSALHGALGRAVWTVVCAFPRRRECGGCLLVSHCVYPRLFEPRAPDVAELRGLGIQSEAPRPLALGPEEGWTRKSGRPHRLAPGDPLPFRITLVGRAIHDLAYILVALGRMAERGLGRSLGVADRDSAAETDGSPTSRHGRFRLERVDDAASGTRIFDAESERVSKPRESMVPASPPPEAVEVVFVSPLRLKRNGRFTTRPSPAEVTRALARRAISLSTLYGEGGMAVWSGESAAVRAAESLTVESLETSLVHVERYSARQRARMSLPGIVGRARWRGGALRELWPLLLFGEVVQVGKGTALGFGRYRLEPLT